MQLEQLAVIWSVLLVNPYLKENCFRIHTDHDAPKWVHSLTDSSGHTAQWLLRLFEFDIDVVQRAGIKQQAMDALSRRNKTNKDESPLENDSSMYAIDSLDNPPVPIHTITFKEDHAQSVPNTK